MAKKSKEKTTQEIELHSNEVLSEAELQELSLDAASIAVTTTNEITEKVTEEITEETAETKAEEVVQNKITDLSEIEQAVEALIFAAPKAMSNQRLRAILNANHFDTSVLPDVLKSIEHAYADKGFNLVKVAGGYQFRSHPKHADIIEKLVEDKPQRLSTSALEVLAIVAYKQPVTRSEIDAVRGVDSGHLLRGLLEKNMARTEGHAETTGRPLLYGTTSYFLEVFGLNSLDDLPALEEFQRELVEAAEGGNADGSAASLDAALLASDPGALFDNSGLAANPDRGSFDEPAEERFEDADFGVMANDGEDPTPEPNAEA